jgi:tRNA-intron endonuclease
MDVSFDGRRVRAGTAAREQFYDSRGYGQPRGGDLELAPVEAAHLLFRGDIDALRDEREAGETLDFQSFLASQAVSEVDFFVYKDLRDRGFYLSPTETDGAADFRVYPRGKGPWDDKLAYRVHVKSERADVSAATLRALADEKTDDEDARGVLAVVDEESEVTYLSVEYRQPNGSTDHDLPSVEGDLLADRVLVADPSEALHERAFYGQPLDRDDDPVQLSLVEAAHLAHDGTLSLSSGGPEQIVDRGREVEGERFDRRLQAYTALRDAGVVPKTGFKFGADFRTYADVESVDDLGHSELLVRVQPTGHTVEPRDLALDVRLAHGVRKTMVYALADREGVTQWLAIERLTP